MAVAFAATSLVGSATSNVFGPFYLAMSIQTLTAIYAFVFIPETRVRVELVEGGIGEESMSLKRFVSNLFLPLKPLLLLLPRKNADGKRKWTLFLLGTSTFIMMTAVSPSIRFFQVRSPFVSLILALLPSHRWDTRRSPC